VNVLYYHNY